MAYNTSSVRILTNSIRFNIAEIDQQEANDMRKEYLSIVDDKKLTFNQKKETIYSKLVEPAYKFLNLKPISNIFTIHIIDKKNRKLNTMKMNNKFISFGRHPVNNIVLSNETIISRIQGFLFIAGDKMIFLDVWSYLGTYVIKRSNINKQCLSTKANKRNILLFNKNEIIHLNAANFIDILIIPDSADKLQLKLFDIYLYKQQMTAANNANNNINNNNDDQKNNDQNINNIQKLNKKQQQFKHWMCNEIALTEYYHIFVENGFDDIKVVSMLNDKDLQKLGVDKIGSRMKLLLYIQKYKQLNANDNDNNNNISVQIEGDHTDNVK